MKNLAIYYLENGRFEESISPLTEAIQINPETESYLNRGNAYVSLGNYKLAISDFDRAIEINPNYAKAYFNRGLAYNILGKYNQAIEDFKIASKLGNKASQDFLRRHGIDW